MNIFGFYLLIHKRIFGGNKMINFTNVAKENAQQIL